MIDELIYHFFLKKICIFFKKNLESIGNATFLFSQYKDSAQLKVAYKN